ncbi:MAG: hypothetical protein PUJ91_07250 [Schaalia hyovaginalis]|nr:hypothetical protein [Schaalia hyovaginalis]
MSEAHSSLRPSPSMDVLALVHALGKAEWGPLSGAEFRGVRVVLEALASIMFDEHRGRSATTVATAKQVRDRAAYSDKWTRDSLHLLEDAGLVEWRRGGVIDGNPQPGRFRIVKSILCDWIEAARRRHDERMRRYIEETRARLRKLRKRTIPPRLRRSDHAEAATNPPPSKGEEGRRAHRPCSPEPSHSAFTNDKTPKKEETMANPMPEFMPRVCHHGNDVPRYCNVCRMKGWQAQWEWDKAERLRARRKDDEVSAARDRALDAYFAQAYPNATPRQRARLALTDTKAQEIAHAY